MRLIDADRLIELMVERDNDCSNPKNMFDKGYSKAIEHMKWEIEQNNQYHCKIFDLSEHDKQIRKDAIDDAERELLSNGFIFTEHALEVWHSIAEQLKEQK